MPLFTYKCNACEHKFEKFFHKNPEDDKEVLCEKCNEKCEKQINFCGTKTELSAKDLYNNVIAPDAKDMIKKMSSGSDKEFFDVYGDN